MDHNARSSIGGIKVPPYSKAEIDCICDSLYQSKDSTRLTSFLHYIGANNQFDYCNDSYSIFR